MNIIIKKQKLENPGIDPGASRMQIERSTTSIHQIPQLEMNIYAEIDRSRCLSIHQ